MNLRILASTMLVQMKHSFARPVFKLCMLIAPVADTILLYYMFRHSGRADFGMYVVLGAGLTSLWETILFSSMGDINRERYNGTLSLLFGMPTRFPLILLGKIIGNTILSFATLIISYITAYVLFGITLTVNSAGLLAAALLLAGVSFVVVSQFTAYALTLSRKTVVYMNCLNFPIFLLCGFAFPIEILPAWALPISYALPPTWAVRMLRMCFAATIEPALFGQYALILIGELVLFALLARLLFIVIDRQVRIHATLEVF